MLGSKARQAALDVQEANQAAAHAQAAASRVRALTEPHAAQTQRRLAHDQIFRLAASTTAWTDLSTAQSSQISALLRMVKAYTDLLTKLAPLAQQELNRWVADGMLRCTCLALHLHALPVAHVRAAHVRAAASAPLHRHLSNRWLALPTQLLLLLLPCPPSCVQAAVREALVRACWRAVSWATSRPHPAATRRLPGRARRLARRLACGRRARGTAARAASTAFRKFNCLPVPVMCTASLSMLLPPPSHPIFCPQCALRAPFSCPSISRLTTLKCGSPSLTFGLLRTQPNTPIASLTTPFQLIESPA